MSAPTSTPEEASAVPPGNIVMIREADTAEPLADDIDFIAIVLALWRGRWILLTTTFLCAVGSIAYALTATEYFRASVLLAPAESLSEGGGLGLGGLGGAIPGIFDLPTEGSKTITALATLESRSFAEEFIEERDLVSTFFADEWDNATGTWLDPSKARDLRDAVDFFHSDVLRVGKQSDTGLVKVSVEWVSPDLAAQWANELVERLNARLRDKALQRARENVDYLTEQLNTTSLLRLQGSISGLLEQELERIMLARGNDEFAFQVNDPAQPP
ncbi:MAG: Wzz/FepE/Etk N-terminal domain-containing protein [Pseudomonadota bacterium]